MVEVLLPPVVPASMSGMQRDESEGALARDLSSSVGTDHSGMDAPSASPSIASQSNSNSLFPPAPGGDRTSEYKSSHR